MRQGSILSMLMLGLVISQGNSCYLFGTSLFNYMSCEFTSSIFMSLLYFRVVFLVCSHVFIFILHPKKPRTPYSGIFLCAFVYFAFFSYLVIFGIHRNGDF